MASSALGGYLGQQAGLWAGVKVGAGWAAIGLARLSGAYAGAQLASWTYAQLLGLFRSELLPNVVDECYELLGMTPQHEWSDINAVYRELSKTAHPDKGGSHEQMVKLNFCKEVLWNVRMK